MPLRDLSLVHAVVFVLDDHLTANQLIVLELPLELHRPHRYHPVSLFLVLVPLSLVLVIFFLVDAHSISLAILPVALVDPAILPDVLAFSIGYSVLEESHVDLVVRLDELATAMVDAIFELALIELVQVGGEIAEAVERVSLEVALVLAPFEDELAFAVLCVVPEGSLVLVLVLAAHLLALPPFLAALESANVAVLLAEVHSHVRLQPASRELADPDCAVLLLQEHVHSPRLVRLAEHTDALTLGCFQPAEVLQRELLVVPA